MNGPGTARTDVLRPSATTLFLRAFAPYQLYRFAWINLRMLAMIRLSRPRRADAGGEGTLQGGRS